MNEFPSSFRNPNSLRMLTPNLPFLQQQQDYFLQTDKYRQCLFYNKNKQEVCKPFLSKDKSPWTLCMEQNFYKAEKCSIPTK